MQRIYIDLGSVPHPTRAALSGDAGPSIGCILGAELDIAVHFFRNNTQEALAGSSTGKLTLKAPGALAGPALFLDATMTPSGSGAATVYKFSGVLSSDELVADLGELTVKTYRASIAWTEPTKAEAKCSDFDLVIENSSTRPEDVIPATTDARWEWIKDAAPEANGFTHDDETKTLSVEAGGGTPGAHAASHGVGGEDPITIAQSQVTNLATDLASKVPATRTVAGKPLSDNITLAKADVGLGNVDNTSDASKPVSTATQTALNAKENTQTAATQVEAEAGSQTAIRSFSPLRIKQAILALAPSGGGAEITTPRVYHVTTAGNDTTGEGTLAKPYLTAQKAFDVGKLLGEPFAMSVIGDGGNLYLTGTVQLTLIGFGRDFSRVGNITGNVSVGGFLRGNGIDMICINSFSIRSSNNGTDGVAGGSEENGGSGGTGGAAVNFEVSGLYAEESVTLNGSYGGNGGPSGTHDGETPPNGGDGGEGGVGGILTLIECNVDDAISKGGTGGDGGSSAFGVPGFQGNGGVGGRVNCIRSTVRTSLSTIGGDGSTVGGDGVGGDMELSNVASLVNPNTAFAIRGSIIAGAFAASL
jgi:hypothetical protein